MDLYKAWYTCKGKEQLICFNKHQALNSKNNLPQSYSHYKSVVPFRFSFPKYLLQLNIIFIPNTKITMMVRATALPISWDLQVNTKQ